MGKRIKGKIKENKGKDKTGNWVKRKTEKPKASESVFPSSYPLSPFILFTFFPYFIGG
jgi:hypothetical protein